MFRASGPILYKIIDCEVECLEKRKRKRINKPAPPRTEPDIFKNIRFLKPSDEFQFECSLCGECCRNVEQSVLLEPYDIYRIASHLRQTGRDISGIEHVISEYAKVKLLPGSEYPVFLLKTRGQKKECVFLNEGRCSIQESKPRACRLYPLSAWPNDTMDGFDYLLASQKRHHITGAALLVSDWMDEFFSEIEREIVLLDAKAMKELAPIIRGMQNAGVDRDRILKPLLLFKYVYFELDEPYVPQFMRNNGLLKNALLEIAPN